MSGIGKVWFVLLLAAVVDMAAAEQLKSAVSLSKAVHSKSAQVNSDAKSDVERQVLIDKYTQELESLQKKIDKDSIWLKACREYKSYSDAEAKLRHIDARIQSLDKNDKKELYKLNESRKTAEGNLKKYNTGKKTLFNKLMNADQFDLHADTAEFRLYEEEFNRLKELVALLDKKRNVLRQLASVDHEHNYTDKIKELTEKLHMLETVKKTAEHVIELRKEEIERIRESLKNLEGELEKDNIWHKSYNTYLSYLDVKHELSRLHKRIQELSKEGDTIEEKDELDQLMDKESILSDQLSLLETHGSSLFANLLTPESIDEQPEITSPIDIFTGVTYNKRINEQLKTYLKRKEDLQKIVLLLRKKINYLSDLSVIDTQNDYSAQLHDAAVKLEKFISAIGTLGDTADVYSKRVEAVELQVNRQIKKQFYKMMNIGIIILVLFAFFLLAKMMAKRYITDNERFYMANKVITFINVTLIIMILLFNYIENVNYLVTVLGFASAGIAIAMKDWFMSMLGWLVIVFGGSIHVGDRVRVDKDGMLYVGDVLDISLLRITILEDITLTTYRHNRRAGRILFIPNNYIFTTMIASYTHVSLKTVWDGIDIMITFDSNHKKATHIAKEITRKYAKGYTDITRKQLNKLRHRYSLKNTNVEPRIFSFIEENGICISSWYLTNAYATLTLRSTISAEILDSFRQQDDITIAYPTQSLYLKRSRREMPQELGGTEAV
jgi:small-conductance mechanosensitive channel